MAKAESGPSRCAKSWEVLGSWRRKAGPASSAPGRWGEGRAGGDAAGLNLHGGPRKAEAPGPLSSAAPRAAVGSARPETEASLHPPLSRRLFPASFSLPPPRKPRAQPPAGRRGKRPGPLTRDAGQVGVGIARPRHSSSGAEEAGESGALRVPGASLHAGGGGPGPPPFPPSLLLLLLLRASLRSAPPLPVPEPEAPLHHADDL